MVNVATAYGSLPAASDLAAELRAANCRGQPLLLMFSSSTCPYCHLVRDLFMEPLQGDARYPGIVVREVEIDSGLPLTDFAGNSTTMEEFASRYGIFLVPTVMAFSVGGNSAGERLIGISNEDFYSHYLDEVIEAGIASLSASPSGAPAGYACD
jgi:thioredoxin-related protein